MGLCIILLSSFCFIKYCSNRIGLLILVNPSPVRWPELISKCVYCDESNMLIHNRKHISENPCMYNQCEKCLSNIHTGERPYICSQCGECSFEAYIDDRQIISSYCENDIYQVHTGERPYICNQHKKCLYRMLTGHRPYRCNQYRKRLYQVNTGGRLYLVTIILKSFICLTLLLEKPLVCTFCDFVKPVVYHTDKLCIILDKYVITFFILL